MMKRTMKDSGVEWIGEIPDNWEILKLKRLGNFYSAGVDKKIRKGENLYKSVHYTDVYYNSLSQLKNSEEYLVISAKEQKAKDAMLLKGDVLFTTSSETPEDIGHSSVIEEDLSNTLMGYHLMRFRPNVELALEYEKYIFGSDYLRGWFSYRANGITRYGIKSSDIKDAPFLKVPIEEQEKIAAFLDQKVAHIENIMGETKKSIENLKSYKHSLINETVTKGLNPNFEMKDSGFKWIGEIPKHWHVEKSKYNYNFNKGLSITKADLKDEGIPVINYGEIHSKYGVKFDPQKNIVKKVDPDYKEYNNAILEYGDVIFADTSEDIEGSGNFTTFLGEAECLAGYHTVVMKPINRTNNIFMTYLFDSLTYRRQIQNMVQGIKVFSITQSILKNTYVWFPPKKEQEEIAMFLDNKVTTLINIISEKEKIIDELQDYKKSLIYEYVTGKKEVK